MNPYNPATQFEQWLAWEKANSGGAPPPPPATPPPAPTNNATLPGTSNVPPKPGVSGGGSTTNYQAQNVANERAIQLATGKYIENPPPNYVLINNGSKAIGPGGAAYAWDNTSNLWYPTFSTKAEQNAAVVARGQQNTQQQNVGLRNAIATSAQPAEQRTGQAIANSAGMMGTLYPDQGPRLPGFEMFNRPGLGIQSEGRRTLRDSGELNTINAYLNRGQIQFGPGIRGAGQTGNNIVFQGGGQNSRIDPQLLFPNVSVSVPDTYVKGQGNTGDFNRAYDVPFNIGPGGASLMNIGGSNVQVQSADKGTGFGFALNAMPYANIGTAYARDLSDDPALQAGQTLSLLAAQNQYGSNAQDILTAANRAQYSGNTPAMAGPWTGNGAASQGQVFAAGQAMPQDVLAELVAQREEEEGTPGMARGGMVVAMPRRARSSGRPLGFASGGTVTYKNTGTGVTSQFPSGTSLPGWEVVNETPTTPEPAPAPAPTGPTSSYNPGPPPTSEPEPDPLGDFNALDAGLLDPFIRAQEQANARDRNRNASLYQWRLAGREAPSAVDVPLGYDTSRQAPSGQYYSQTKALNDRINAVTSAREDLRATGASGISPAAVNARIAELKQSAGYLADLQDAEQKLVSLGGPPDPQAILNMQQNILGLSTSIANLGNPDPFANPSEFAVQEQWKAALAEQKAALAEAEQHANAYQQALNTKQNLYAASGLTPAQVNQQLGAYAANLAALQQQLQQATAAQGLRQKVYNLTVGSPLPGFKNGGTVTAGKKSMVTPERIWGVGDSGEVYFQVGEPRTPGGPPAPERLTITPLPMGRRKVAA